MINFKKRFQNVLILSTVWISFTSAPPNPQLLKECKDGMVKAFKSLETLPLDCIKIAIKTLKKDLDDIHRDARHYYNTFANAVIFSNIQIPPLYCTKMTDDIENEKEQEEEQQRCIKDLSGFGDNSSFKAYQETVLASAISQHKQVSDEKEKDIQNCHSPDSYGYGYLDHICKVIKLKQGVLKNPNGFCETKYGEKNYPVTSV